MEEHLASEEEMLHFVRLYSHPDQEPDNEVVAVGLEELCAPLKNCQTWMLPQDR